MQNCITPRNGMFRDPPVVGLSWANGRKVCMSPSNSFHKYSWGVALGIFQILLAHFKAEYSKTLMMPRLVFLLISRITKIPYWTLVYPKGSYVITRVPSLVRPWSVLGQSLVKYPRNFRLFFLIFCIKLRHDKGRKVTARFLKWVVGWSQRGENPFFGGHSCCFHLFF